MIRRCGGRVDLVSGDVHAPIGPMIAAARVAWHAAAEHRARVVMPGFKQRGLSQALRADRSTDSALRIGAAEALHTLSGVHFRDVEVALPVSGHVVGQHELTRAAPPARRWTTPLHHGGAAPGRRRWCCPRHKGSAAPGQVTTRCLPSRRSAASVARRRTPGRKCRCGGAPARGCLPDRTHGPGHRGSALRSVPGCRSYAPAAEPGRRAQRFVVRGSP